MELEASELMTPVLFFAKTPGAQLKWGSKVRQGHVHDAAQLRLTGQNREDPHY
jgi:hypothetical protein